jgi:hypothetical protein
MYYFLIYSLAYFQISGFIETYINGFLLQVCSEIEENKKFIMKIQFLREEFILSQTDMSMSH